ncbi:hypothetical protein ACIBH1_15175 [Nonomuraea sp. NPDC050663]|uniref:hypothetical protein n=1 Tax=Nonomuraea sp. NPDC050663 TaxID=3364370 RepID=UPI0037B8B37F
MAVAWGPVRGRVVFDSTWQQGVREQQSTGFSWTGTRSLLVTDWPAVYVHDSGGMGLGRAPAVVALDPARDPEASIELADNSTRLVADLRLPQGRSIRLSSGVLPPAALATLTGLRGRLLPDAAAADFVSPCAVSITPHFESSEGVDGEVTAYVVLAGGRLMVRARGEVLVEWPVNRAALSAYGPSSVRLRGGALLGGRFLTGATLHLATVQVRQAFMAATSALHEGSATVAVPMHRPSSAAAPAGLSAPVTIRGPVSGSPAVKADCILTDDALEFQATDTQRVVAAFTLDDPQLRVAGSAERFVVFTPAHGPLAVTCDSGTFGRRLHENTKLREAAERTLTSGILPAELADGSPVAIAFAGDGIRMKGPDVNVRIAYDTIRGVDGDLTGARPALRVSTERGEHVIVAQPEVVQTAHIEIRTWSYASATPRQIPDLLRAAVGLEEDYLLYTIFGPFYELHAALLGEGEGEGEARAGAWAGAGAGAWAGEVFPAEAPEERARVAAVLQIGLGELQRHLDQVAFVLPAFLRHRDALLIKAAGGGEPAWLKQGEAALRAALAPTQRIAAETAQLVAQVSRIVDLDPEALPKVSYAGAAVSLGAAALINPVFAVSGLSQAYSARTQGEKRKAHVTAQSERGWATVLERWNALIATTLPVLAYVITENVFAQRWAAAQRISTEVASAKQPGAALQAVARRLATLDVLRKYPASPAVRLRRGEIADQLRARRDSLSTPRFTGF